jgi:hypothetical protein
VYDLSLPLVDRQARTLTNPVLRSIHVAGTLTFARDRNTRLNVGLIKIQAGDDASEDGFNCDAHVREPEAGAARPSLEVGTAEDPIPVEYTATIEFRISRVVSCQATILGPPQAPISLAEAGPCCRQRIGGSPFCLLELHGTGRPAFLV